MKRNKSKILNFIIGLFFFEFLFISLSCLTLSFVTKKNVLQKTAAYGLAVMMNSETRVLGTIPFDAELSNLSNWDYQAFISKMDSSDYLSTANLLDPSVNFDGLANEEPIVGTKKLAEFFVGLIYYKSFTEIQNVLEAIKMMLQNGNNSRYTYVEVNVSQSVVSMFSEISTAVVELRDSEDFTAFSTEMFRIIDIYREDAATVFAEYDYQLNDVIAAYQPQINKVYAEIDEEVKIILTENRVEYMALVAGVTGEVWGLRSLTNQSNGYWVETEPLGLSGNYQDVVVNLISYNRDFINQHPGLADYSFSEIRQLTSRMGWIFFAVAVLFLTIGLFFFNGTGKFGWTGFLIILACFPGMVLDIKLDNIMDALPVNIADGRTARFIEYALNQLSDGIVDAFSIPMYAGVIFIVAALLDLIIKKIDFKKKSDEKAEEN